MAVEVEQGVVSIHARPLGRALR
ncbi:protein of unknown function [Trichlorobacter ammonificans]|uniref:Uncharacterized protein n=1 Tax=Trichlorobacter ammonificans TaxID=2916410 RepID=A0ABM9D6F3_9BACT|nr:protein of unknown function [Trichlorobacter ammonificans]